MPDVADRYREKFEAAGIDVIGISQFGTTEADTIAFVEHHRLTFPIIYDEHAQLASAYGVEGVPSYVFLDKGGRIAHRSAGARGVALLENVLDNLQAE